MARVAPFAMLLTLTTTTPPARDLGHLLRKHPDRLQTFALGFGAAHVFYPEASDARCTAALLLDVDPVGLVRGRPSSRDEGGLVEAYVNDRPYAASSFLSVAIARVLGTALGGRSDSAELVQRERALEARVTPVRARGGELVERLFAPLGYAVRVEPVAVPGAAHAGRHVTLALAGATTLQRLLSHLYVLVPVLDDEKHYWVGDAEVDKLFRHGGDWLAAHPERELIARRYLRRAPKLARSAVARLAELDDAATDDTATGTATGEAVAANHGAAESREETVVEKPLRLQDRRIAAVLGVLRDAGARSVVDLGCGGGDLLLALARDAAFERVAAIDVSARELERAKERLDRALMPASRRERVELFQSSVLYRDARVAGFDAAALLEVVEHVEPSRLPALVRSVFGAARPRTVVITTPNREYNARFPALADGAFRHPDHRFEWSRAEFRAWAETTANAYGYAVSYRDVGDADETLGAPTQMAVFACS
ncbi:MAG: 3 terminal ribose 2-O-methyltransferase Hen1 [Candidatus Eremiobacteraeota bacterium]|nr:3 terminal ribose 2-O-methyltransferase Hen1 [Candidatus Eremiobacteraeota bacterium]